jgi:light-regulated signal transduction histidine kinase (bacteriophytochrome)
MGVLIDDLLGFSRMGRADMVETRVNLDSLVQDTLRDLEPATRARNIVWKIPPLPAVQADPAMLKLALTNLLNNAVKFTGPRDPAVIEVGVMEDGSNGALEKAPDAAAVSSQNSNTPPRQHSIVFFVRDNGVGFDPQYAHKLFGVFQRLHRADEFQGTGIGLANVRRMIARQGGRVWAEGQLNEGATFYFTLKGSEVQGFSGSTVNRRTREPLNPEPLNPEP